MPYYEADGITIYHADCRVVLPLLGDFDLLLTDPPYGIGVCNRSDGGVGSIASGSKFYGREEWDHEPPPAWLFGLMLEKARNAIVWGGNFFNLPPQRCWLVWDKGQRDFTFADAELAWTNLPKAVRALTVPRSELVAEGKRHPTQKPLRLVKWAIQQAPDDCATILDPFMGAGTTLVAARDLGKRAVGIEREERYCAAAVDRLRQCVLPLCSNAFPAML